MKLGSGAYGTVVARDGKAIKRFHKLSHLVQEYAVSRYLEDCEYVVHATSINISKLEMGMDLYDLNFRAWLEHEYRPRHDRIVLNRLLRDILLGLIELHDRGLVHGDLKPSNVLLDHKRRAVLGDLGFVSLQPYAKVERTGAVYRDPVIRHSWTHDIYSYGVILFETLSQHKLTRQPTYRELRRLIGKHIRDEDIATIIRRLVSRDVRKRPTPRLLYTLIFGTPPPITVLYTDWNEYSLEPDTTVYNIMRTAESETDAPRAPRGYSALTRFFSKHGISRGAYNAYVAATIIILASNFGRNIGRRTLSLAVRSKDELNDAFVDLLEDRDFLSEIFAP